MQGAAFAQSASEEDAPLELKPSPRLLETIPKPVREQLPTLAFVVSSWTRVDASDDRSVSDGNVSVIFEPAFPERPPDEEVGNVIR